MVGIGIGFSPVGIEIQLAVTANAAAFNFQKGRIVGAGYLKHQCFTGENRPHCPLQIVYQNHAAVQVAFVSRNGDENHAALVIHSLVYITRQIHILTLHIHLGFTQAAQLGQLNIGGGSGGADCTCIQLHAQFGDKGYHAVGHTFHGNGRSGGTCTVVQQVITCHFGQVAAAAFQAVDYIMIDNKQVGAVVNAPYVHIIGMAQIVKQVAAVICIVKHGGTAAVLIRHGDKGIGIGAVHLHGIQHLGANRHTLHSGAGAVIIDFRHVGILGINRGTNFLR